MEGVTGLVVWLVIAVVLLGVEMLTLTFVSLYLAVGAVGAAIAAALGADFLVQMIVLGVTSIASLVLTRRPLMRALNRTPAVVSNAATVVGKRAVVTVAIEPGPGTRGQIRVGTEYWSARSPDERPLAAGSTVEVVEIDGVTAVVRPVPAGAG